MAKMDLIKGIDNSCEAARRARRRAEANGVVWRTGPALRGINNDTFKNPLSWGTVERLAGGCEPVASLPEGREPSTPREEPR